MKPVFRLLATLAPLLLVTAASAQSGASLSVDEPVVDLGVVQTGSTVTHTFVLRNDGDRPLEIREVDPDCGCTVVEYDRVIQPGQRGELTATVDVSTFAGPIAKYVLLVTNDAGRPEVPLTIKVEVRPQIQIRPGYVRFLGVVGDEPQDAEQTIWASDVEDFRVDGVRSPYPFVRARVREAEEGEEHSEGEGRQWIVEVRLAGDAPIGPMADYLLLDTNHPDHPRVRIPVSGFVRPVLAPSPPFIDFGTRQVDSPIRASVEVENFSDEPIALTSVTSTSPQVVPEIQLDGDDYYVIVTLAPGKPKGEFTETVTVLTDSSRVPRLRIEVRGTVL